MNLPVQVDQKQLMDILLNVGTVRPVFIWGAPGIGKSAIVEQFAKGLGLECVSLLGSQLAPEDIIGVPQIRDGQSVFCPPRSIARDEPYCLFLDELNACSHEVQKAFYSLILERRIGEYHLPEGSIVIGAGNRAQDNAITRPMSSALLNRMFHVEMTANSRIWLEWAAQNNIHRYVYDYICSRPDHLWAQPPKTEEPFSTPRSWHMLSDAIHSYGDNISEANLSLLAHGLDAAYKILEQSPLGGLAADVMNIYCDNSYPMLMIIWVRCTASLVKLVRRFPSTRICLQRRRFRLRLVFWTLEVMR